jgi:hypothetical protein
MKPMLHVDHALSGFVGYVLTRDVRVETDLA